MSKLDTDYEAGKRLALVWSIQ